MHCNIVNFYYVIRNRLKTALFIDLESSDNLWKFQEFHLPYNYYTCFTSMCFSNISYLNRPYYYYLLSSAVFLPKFYSMLLYHIGWFFANVQKYVLFSGRIVFFDSLFKRNYSKIVSRITDFLVWEKILLSGRLSWLSEFFI